MGDDVNADLLLTQWRIEKNDTTREHYSETPRLGDESLVWATAALRYLRMIFEDQNLAPRRGCRRTLLVLGVELPQEAKCSGTTATVVTGVGIR